MPSPGNRTNHASGPAHYNYKHGGKRIFPFEYRTWAHMRYRCLNPQSVDWNFYGGRGITIDPRWTDFEAFIEDMGRRPGPLYTLERVNNNLGYTKQNCVWATRTQQARNRRRTRLSQTDVNVIRFLYASGKFTQREISKNFDILPSYISQIIRRKIWQDD